MSDFFSFICYTINHYLIESVNEITNVFFNNNYVFLCLSTFLFVYLFAKRDKLKTGYNLFFAFSVMVGLIVIYNPLIWKKLFDTPDLKSVYARFWLLCPLWLVIAYGLSSMITQINPKRKAFFSIITTVVVIIAGNTIGTMMIPTGTIYKIRPEAVEIADEIQMINDGKPTSLLIFIPIDEYDGRYINNGTVYDGITQYTGKIMVYPRGYTDEKWDDYYTSDYQPNGGASVYFVNAVLAEEYESHPFEYVAFPDDQRILSKMLDIGYDLVGHTSNYYIFSFA